MLKEETTIAAGKISWVLVKIALIWVLSDAAYYVILPLIGLRSSYNAEPIGITVYYLLWVIITLVAFWPVFRIWRPITDGWRTYATLGLILVGVVIFLAFILQQFPPIVWKES